MKINRVLKARESLESSRLQQGCERRVDLFHLQEIASNLHFVGVKNMTRLPD